MMLVRAGSLFAPGRGFIKDVMLLIREGVIVGIYRPGVQDNCELPEEKVIVHDYLDSVLSPPFCDYHLHFPKARLSEGDIVASALLKSGIMRVHEAGDKNMAGIEMEKAIGERIDIKTSGYAIYKKGSYGGFIGKGVEDFSEATREIDHLNSLGVDYLKLVTSGIFSPSSGTITEGGFERQEIREIIAYASEKGLPVVCHANGDRAIRASAEAGAWAVVHGFYVSDETLSIMAKKKVRLIPTVKALLSLVGMTGEKEQKERVERLVDEHLEVIGKTHDKGVQVLPGSDSGPALIPYGSSYLQELELFRKAGFSEEEILSSAVTGSLEEGMPANFLVLKGLSVEKVFVAGVPVSTQQI
jgi:imidazolonepropionase-like amidohydrolase